MTAPAEHQHEDLQESYTVGGSDTFRVASEEKAAWVVNKLLGYEEQLARLDAQHQKMRAQLIARRDSFSAMFHVPLRQWAEANLPSKGRTVHLLTGSLSFRRVKAGAKVTDQKAAVRWAEENLPDAVLVTVNKRADGEALRLHFEETGEIAPGVVFQEERDEFYIKAAKPAEEEF